VFLIHNHHHHHHQHHHHHHHRNYRHCQHVLITKDVNYSGVTKVTNALLPLIRKGGRVILVSSKAGQVLKNYSDAIKARIEV
jgi:NAD(P)-dependent dehydrogenase (short-subunit alcohol dehydrogenase family)